MNEFNAVSVEELAHIEGGVGVGTYFGNMGRLYALQKNGANVSEPPLGGKNSYFPSGGGVNRGDGYGNVY